MTSQPHLSAPIPQTWTAFTKEWLPVLGSFTTILIPVTWLIGRSFMIGYHQAFGIPITQLTLSLPDYIENGWISLIVSLVFSILLSAGLLIYGWIIIPELRNMLLNPSQRKRWIAVIYLVICIFAFWGAFVPRTLITFGCASLLALVVIVAPRLVKWTTQLQQTPIAQIMTRTGFALGLLIPLVLFLFLTSYVAYTAGKTTGHQAFGKTMFAVRLSANVPLMLDTATPSAGATPTNALFVYENVYLLTFNDGRYFVFKTVNAACQPEKVYVVQESQLRTVDYSLAMPPQPNCATYDPNTPTSPVPLPAVPSGPVSSATPTP